MQANHGAQEDTPQQKWQPAYREEHDSEHDHGNVMVLGDPDMELVFREVGHIAG